MMQSCTYQAWEALPRLVANAMSSLCSLPCITWDCLQRLAMDPRIHAGYCTIGLINLL